MEILLADTTLKQLVMRRPDLVADIKVGKDEGTTVVFVVKDTQGRMSIWTEERKDLDEIVIFKRVNIYSYYLTGEINEIVQERYKEKVLISKKRIKHYRDGAQPDMISMSIKVLM